MGRKTGALFGASLLSLFAANAAYAQTNTAAGDDAATEEVIVVGERVARGNNVVGAARIADQPAAQNIVDAIKLVPGVQIRGGDASNNDPWSYAINIRGFEVNLRNSKIGQTLDGVPLFNASYYLGGSPAQKFILAESVDRIQVNQGTADVGSPSSAALGGTIAYFSRDPAQEAGGLVRATFGSQDSRRFFGRYDTGEIFGNTRAYLAVADLDSRLWPHGGSTTAAIEQFAVEGKSVSVFGPLTVTLYGSYNDSDDDPIIEATRAFINTTNFTVDGSTSVFNTTDAAANEYWADEWAAVRENTLAYARFNVDVNDAFSFDVTPYAQRNEGVGEFIPPGIRGRFNTTGGAGALRQVMFGGSEIRASRAIVLGASGNSYGVLPYDGANERIYTALDGTVVRSNLCFNADNSIRVNATGNNAGQPVCSSAQSYRNSLYYHRRFGVVANAALELGQHKLRFGGWYENLDRDFGRAWRNYIDIRNGPAAIGPIYRQDFLQNFKTDLWKFYIADDWAVSDRMTVSLGLQHYLVDIEGASAEPGINFNAQGVQTSTTRLAVNSDSEDLLPSIGVVYDATDAVQLFAGWSRNFGAIGDWALEKTGTDLRNLEPEVSNNFEAGLRFRGDRARGAVTVYRNEYDNPIVFLTNDFAVGTPGINYNAGTGGTYFNIKGGIETQGVEGSVEFDVTEKLSAYFAASFIDATYTDAFRAASYGGNPVIVAAGSTVAGTPELILAGALSYTDGGFSGRLSARHVGEAPGDAANTPALTMPSYTVLDLTARYRQELQAGRYLEFGFGVNNLTDERYIGGMLDEFTQRFVVAAPRTASLTVSLGF
jgi:iron complex outermembrane recepter protein